MLIKLCHKEVTGTQPPQLKNKLVVRSDGEVTISVMEDSMSCSEASIGSHASSLAFHLFDLFMFSKAWLELSFSSSHLK